MAPRVECLESRRLLSFFTGPATVRPVVSRAGAFLVQVSGPGVVKVLPAAQGGIDLTAYGTTTDSTITITQTRARYHFPNQFLAIHNFIVKSGQLGSLEAAAAALYGKMTPLASTVRRFAIGGLGPKAQVDINGNVGTMIVSTINLGPTGHVAIAGDMNSLAQSSQMQIGAITLDGGDFTIGRDSLESIQIAGNMSVSRDGRFSVGRDQDGIFTVTGSLLLQSGGQLRIGRNLNGLTVEGNLIVSPSGSGVAVLGALNGLTVDGYFQGQGGTTAPTVTDLGVGLNLTSLTIVGGVPGQGGLNSANVRAGGSISGINIAYGSVNSSIQPNTQFEF
jgi:hypothetical protein